ncbi:hypothetical protein ECP03047774_5095 [Escherichia coli P0304777.4]|nr:hypothetical protein ECP03047774_5095 [Escherichia coli P0304777.4]
MRTFSGDLISEASGTLTSSVCASRADRTFPAFLQIYGWIYAPFLA